MYVVNADDFHLPRLWINESESSAAAATDAAPMRKQWPKYPWTLIPAWLRAKHTAATRYTRVSGVPFSLMNSGPGVWGRTARYASNAATGHIGPPVRPITSVTPVPNTSVLLCVSNTVMHVGCTWLSTWICNGDKGHGLCDAWVNSPQCKNPKKKKPKHAAAHNMTRSYVSGCVDHTRWRHWRMDGVIGSRLGRQ